MNFSETNPSFKGKPSPKKGATIVVDMDIALLNADKNNKRTKINRKTTKNQKKTLNQNMKKKDHSLPNKNVQTNNSSGKSLPGCYNNFRLQSPYGNKHCGRSADRTKSKVYSQKRYIRSITQKISIEIITQDQI